MTPGVWYNELIIGVSIASAQSCTVAAMTTIDIRGVAKAFGSVAVLEHVSLAVAPEERLVIVGPSGCGKTTLLRLIAGLDAPDAGEIWLDGQQASSPERIIPPHMRNIGMAFQAPALWPHMTVWDNIAFGLTRLNKNEIRDRIQEALEHLGLERLARRYPHQISGGEARRVALARALAPRPAILLLDEPLTHLNPELKQKVLVVIQTHLERYRPVLVYVTHDHDEAHLIASRIVRLEPRIRV